MDWFYESNGQQSGPVSREEILRLIMQQRIRPETLVWNPSFGDSWRPASAAGLVSPLTGFLRPKAEVSEHWAWVLLVGPWLMGRMTLYIMDWRHVPEAARMNTNGIVGLLVLGLFFTAFTLDRNAIREAGNIPPGFWWWLFLPGYFWRRRQVVGKGMSLLVVSLVLLVFNIGDTIARFPEIREQARHAHHASGSVQSTAPADGDGEQENL